MLQVAFIRENKDLVLKGLAKRNFKNAEIIISDTISADEERRSIQTELDSILAESNKLSKDIGILFKSGERQKAEILKQKTIQLKENSKILNENLVNKAAELKNLLVQIPNIPNEMVPSGSDEEDNIIVFQEGDIPNLFDGALPHWELAKK